MSRVKYGPMADYRDTEPFSNAEEVWFWCCFCEGCKSQTSTNSLKQKTRPCESNDVLIVIKRLILNKEMTQLHLKVLSKFGLKQEPPHVDFGATKQECSLWNQAIRAMEKIFIQKRIVSVK